MRGMLRKRLLLVLQPISPNIAPFPILLPLAIKERRTVKLLLLKAGLTDLLLVPEEPPSWWKVVWWGRQIW